MPLSRLVGPRSTAEALETFPSAQSADLAPNAHLPADTRDETPNTKYTTLTACALFLSVLTATLFFFGLGERGLNSSHEARAAQNAQSILDNADWLLPMLFDRQVELQKPPLYYWLVALVAQVRGGRVDAICVRLPAALAALGTVWVVFGVCAVRGRAWAGLLAAVVLTTFWHFTWTARVGRIDMPLTFAVTVAAGCSYLGWCQWRERGGNVWGWMLASYAAIGLGLLLKGPIAAVLPAAVLLPPLLLCGGEDSERGARVAPLRRWVRAGHAFGLWWGVPLVIGIALPWFWLANEATRGDLFRVFFLHHNFARGLGGSDELAAYPWWYYGPRLAVDLLPWGLFLPLAFVLYVRNQAWRRDGLATFALVWLSVVTLLLSCASFKRADYLLPAYPGAALFLGCTAETCWRRVVPGQWRRVVVGTAVTILVGYAVAWGANVLWLIPAQDASRPERRFAEEVRSRTSEPVLFFRVEDHDIAFYTGAPVVTLLEWENLDAWLARRGTVFVVMPVAEARSRGDHLSGGRLVEVLRTEDLTNSPAERPLVLLRSVR